MPFTNAFDVGSPFAFNPASPSLPQNEGKLQARAAMQKPPAENAMPEPPSYKGAEALGAALGSPLLEGMRSNAPAMPSAIPPARTPAPMPMQNYAIPMPPNQLTGMPMAPQQLQQLQRLYPNQLVYI